MGAARSGLLVAVTGHRPGGMCGSDQGALRAEVRGVLERLADLAARTRIEATSPTLVSQLAEGADRLVAEEARSAGFRLVVVLPFPVAEYENDFADAASRRQFRRLVAQAVRIEEIPWRPGGDREAAYAAAGQQMLDGCRILIAVWDGRPSRGWGGTAEIVSAAEDRGITVVHISSEPPHGSRVVRQGAGPVAGGGLEVADVAIPTGRPVRTPGRTSRDR